MFRITAWCRADLAGGTLDIWPLGLLHPGARTINFAIDLAVTVSARRLDTGYRVHLAGSSRNVKSRDELSLDPSTALLGVVAEESDLPPCELEIASASPRGAGLGASSALTVALLAAAEALECGRLERTPAARAAVARDLEARLMGLPTGLQDHYPAQLGGALEIEHLAGGERLRPLHVDLEALGDRLLIAFTGQSHFSAGANWQVIRRRLENDRTIVDRLDEIRDVARSLPAALEAGRWDEAGALVAAEWAARRQLSEEIPTPRIERLLALGRELGAWGGKAGGAGGGGSVFLLAPPDRRGAIAEAWRREGAEILEARPTARRLELEGAGLGSN